MPPARAGVRLRPRRSRKRASEALRGWRSPRGSQRRRAAARPSERSPHKRWPGGPRLSSRDSVHEPWRWSWGFFIISIRSEPTIALGVGEQLLAALSLLEPSFRVPRLDHEVIGRLADPGQHHFRDLHSEPVPLVSTLRLRHVDRAPCDLGLAGPRARVNLRRVLRRG